jgi:predicted RNA methylase
LQIISSPSLDGVLGGPFEYLTPVDVRDSSSFLDKLQAAYPAIRFDHVVDCGAGIGRITKNLLLPRSKHVTLIDQSPGLLNASSSYIGSIPNGKTVSFVQQSFQVSRMFTVRFISSLFGFVFLGFRSCGEVH